MTGPRLSPARLARLHGALADRVLRLRGDPRREGLAAPVGQYGWDGGLGTVWRNDPAEGLTTVLLTNVAWTAPRQPEVAQDFLTAAYAAIEG